VIRSIIIRVMVIWIRIHHSIMHVLGETVEWINTCWKGTPQ